MLAFLFMVRLLNAMAYLIHTRIHSLIGVIVPKDNFIHDVCFEVRQKIALKFFGFALIDDWCAVN